MAIHRKLKKSYLEAIAALAERSWSTVIAEQTATNGTISVDNGDGTRTVIGTGAGTDETGASNGTAYFVGDVTPPGAPEGVAFVTGNGCITGVWGGSLDGGVPADFNRVAFRIDGTEFGEVNVAGSAMSGELEAGTSYECDAVAYDVQGNMSDACDAVTITCRDAAAEATEAAEAASSAAATAAEAAQAASDAADALADDITEIQTTVTDLSTTVSGAVETATEALELATTVETSLEGFEVTVAETYATQSELADVSDTANAAATDAASALEQVSTLSVTVEGVTATAESAYTTATEALANAATAQATADAITTKVAEEYTTTADLKEMLGDYVTDDTLSATLSNYSTTEQTAESISSAVSSALYTTDEDGNQTAIYASTSYVDQQDDAILSQVASTYVSADDAAATYVTQSTLTQTAEDLTAEFSSELLGRNLFPGFSAPADDDDFWYNLSDEWTIGDDGWGIVDYDNSSSSSSVSLYAYQTPIESLETDTKYTILTEIKDCTVSGTVYLYSTSVAVNLQSVNTLSQFNEAVSHRLSDGDEAVYYTSVATQSDFSSCRCSLAPELWITSGSSCAASIRISLYKGAYTGQYNSYISSYTYSSLIRASGDGVEVAKLVDGEYTGTKTVMDSDGFHVQDSNGNDLTVVNNEGMDVYSGDRVVAEFGDDGMTLYPINNETVVEITDSMIDAYTSGLSCAQIRYDTSGKSSQVDIDAGSVFISGETSGTNLDNVLYTSAGGPVVIENAELEITEQIISTASDCALVHTHSTSGSKVSFGVGGGGSNRGIYDDDNSRWLIYANSSGATLLQTQGGAYYATSQGNKRIRYIDFGSVTISGGSGSVTSATVTFNVEFESTPYVFVTANSTVPGTVTEVSVAGRSTTGCTVYTMRSSSSSTAVMWMAVGNVS